MSHDDLADEPDTRPRWWHAPRDAVFWGIAAALCAGAAWVGVAVAARPVFEIALRTNPAQREAEPIAELTAIGAGSGLAIGMLAGFVFVRRRGLDDHLGAMAAFSLVAAAAGGVGGGLSVPMIAAFPSLPIEVSTGLAWAVAGLIGGTAGGIGRRFWPIPEGRTARDTSANWALTSALAGGLTAAIGAVAGQLYFNGPLWDREWTPELYTLTGYLAGAGAAGGSLVGAIVGARSRRGRRLFGSPSRSAVRLGLLGGLTGLLAGLAPLMVVGLGRAVPVEATLALAGAAAGLVAGVVGHGWTHPAAKPVIEVGEHPGGQAAVSEVLRPSGPPMVGLLPVLAVAVLTFVAAIATFPPGTRVVLVAVGLLGLAVAYVQAGQERRIRDLERRLRRAEAPDSPGTPT